MTKESCTELILQNFNVESFILGYKESSLNLTSRLFYYNELYKNIKQLKLLRIHSKNTSDEISFIVYFFSEDFGGLTKGYFKIYPEGKRSTELLQYSNKVCYDLEEYFLDLFNHNELFKLYLITKNYSSSYETYLMELKAIDFSSIKEKQVLKISSLSPKDFSGGFLEQKFLYKYIEDFLKFNFKISPTTKGFLLYLLTYETPNNILFLNGLFELPFCIKVSYNRIDILNEDSNLQLYYFTESIKSQNMTLYIQFNFDFGGI